jgi:peptide/nickel transport system permease protein|tara:strand:- start:731 stop:1627 length:897 start_codon:yes stop_codon:yes gene_type:complete
MGVVALFVFLLLHLSPGDPATVIAGDYASPADIARIRAQLGLDQPLYIQFTNWLAQLSRGDLGISIFSNLPVSQLIHQRVEPTLSLALLTLFIAISVAVPLGILAAWKAGTWVDRTVMAFSVLGFSTPVFVLGYALIYIFSLKLGLFPVQGFTSISDGLLPFLHRLILPSITLSVIFIALFARITRASILEILNEDYIRTARAKGLKDTSILFRHALPNAAVPIVTVIGIGFALLIGGVVVTESVYNIPGLGRLTVDAVLRRDYPVIQGIILVFSALYVLVNLIIDILYVALDPRIRF